MDNERLIENLDQAVDLLLANRDVATASQDAEVAELIRIAAELRNLPRTTFKAQLANDLNKNLEEASDVSPESEVSKPMSAAPQRVFRTVTPYVSVKNIYEVIDFVKAVFDAKGTIYGTGSQGGIHSEFKIGDAMLMMGGGETFRGEEMRGTFHIYVEDVDEVYRRAVQSGATSLHEPMDQEYGERSAAFTDPGGNQWYPATASGGSYIAEGAQSLMPYLHPKGAAKQIEFLEQAFGAEEQFRHASPEGVIYHAKVQLGSSIIEMGEAHDQWQPVPAMFMLYVEDVDAMYARALAVEGASSLSEPSDQAYGDRVGAIRDPFQNIWYIASHLSQLG